MNGRIWAENSPGAGATFYFTARFGAAPPAETTTPENYIAPLPTSLADGFRRVAYSGRGRFRGEPLSGHRVSQELGCRLEYAENGQIAVEKFCSGAYDLVLMDLQMPVMDGYEATRRIRGWEEEQKRSLTPIVALTASALETELQKALDAGCTACLRKPVRLITLLEAVRKYAAGTSTDAAAKPEKTVAPCR